MIYVFKNKKVGHVFTITSDHILSINPLPYDLKKHTTLCPCHNQPLYFENMGGMRIIRDGKISAKCGESNKYFSVKAR